MANRTSYENEPKEKQIVWLAPETREWYAEQARRIGMTPGQLMRLILLDAKDHHEIVPSILRRRSGG